MTLNGTAELTSRDKILRREWGNREKITFLVQLTTRRIDSRIRLIRTLLRALAIHSVYSTRLRYLFISHVSTPILHTTYGCGKIEAYIRLIGLCDTCKGSVELP